MDIQDWIIEWFSDNTIAKREELLQGLESNYFECGWLDSMAFITLLSAIEEKFDLVLDNDSFQDSGFTTIAGLARILHSVV